MTGLVVANDEMRVYRGFADDQQRPVLLKTVTAGSLDPRGHDRLRREFELLASLKCPGVPRPYALLTQPSLVLVHEDGGGALQIGRAHV